MRDGILIDRKFNTTILKFRKVLQKYFNIIFSNTYGESLENDGCSVLHYNIHI